MSMKHTRVLAAVFLIIVTGMFVLSFFRQTETEPEPVIFHAQGEMAGEVTRTSVILQSRLTAADSPDGGDVPGKAGIGCFEVSTVSDFTHYLRTPWMDASPENDYIIKYRVTPLTPGTRYFYRLVYGTDEEDVFRGDACTFRTLPEPDVSEEVSLVVVTGMNYSFFHEGKANRPETAYRGPDRHLGYPALETILSMKPDFFVGTGDNVYYDHPASTRARTQAELRKKWHEQFVQERYRKLFAAVPTYWEKDDHDYRYNDSDTTNIYDPAKPEDTEIPSHELGIATFLEQVPVVDPEEPEPVTYRTHRISKHLQIWLTEGRDYRSPNSMPDGPDKTLWGKEQKEWLKQTLLESDAVFKLLISPTPMVGPDDAYKSDNHVNQKGFRHEADEFFGWLTTHGFLNNNFYLVCGDRHWQYHSVHPSGFEEFSCGALVDANSRLGRKPGDPESTDPEALIRQIYTQEEASGGFLKITITPGSDSTSANSAPSAEFSFYDENGVQFYSVIKNAQ